MKTDALPRPWYREPMLWIVFGLPASVVVAGFLTLGIAIVHRDQAPAAAIDATLSCIPTGNSKLPPDCR